MSCVRLSEGSSRNRYLRLVIFNFDGRVDASPHVEVAGDGHFSRPARAHKIVENLIDNRLVKSPLIAIGPKIKFQGFELDAELVGNVINSNSGEIGLAGAGTKTGKLRTLHVDLIVAFRVRIGKAFEIFACCGRHRSILARRKCISKSPSYLDLKM